MKRTIQQKFETYDSTTRIVIDLIEILNINVTKSTISDTLQNHPSYPSLLSISDAFTKWNIDNTSYELNSEILVDIPTPYISYINGH